MRPWLWWEWGPETRVTKVTTVFVARPNPLVALWRWRYETVLLAGVPTGVVFAIRSGYLIWLLGTGAFLVAAMATWPAVRSVVWAMFWVVVTPHRIRRGCAEALIVNRRGKLPAVLWTRAEPFGERVWLWCRAGMTPGDFEASRRLLALACWADDVRVARTRNSLLVLDVIRRPGRHGAPEREDDRPRSEPARVEP